ALSGRTNLVLWDAAGWEEICTLDGVQPQNRAVRFVSISPDGKRGLAASGDVLVLWDVRDGKQLREMQPRPRDPIPDTKWPSGKSLQRLDWHRREITGVTVDWKARQVVTGDREGVLRFWDLSTGKMLRKVEVFPPPDGEGGWPSGFGVRGLCLSPDG